MTRAQRKDFVSFQHATGLTEALQDALLLESEENEQGCLNYYTIPPANDPYRPTPSLDGPSGFPVNIPEGLEYWTADQIAECVSGISHDTFVRLWQIVSECEKNGTAMPLGGDGSNGTTELPIVADSYGNQPHAFWAALTRAQQQEIAYAYIQQEG